MLTLNDGTQIEGHCMPGSGDFLYVYLTGKTVSEGVILFSDPEKTCKIVETEYGKDTVYEGYTEIVSADHDFGNCNLAMRKE